MSARPGVPALMILLIVLNIAAGVDRMIVAVLAPAIQPALRLSNPQLGVVQGPAFALPHAAGLPIAGWLVDRYGPRRILVGAVALWTAGLALSAAATGLGALVAGRALCGLGQSALLPVALQVIAAGVRPDRVGRAIALFTGTGTLGRSAAFALGGLLLAWFAGHGVRDGWSSTLAVLAASNLALLAVVLAFRLPDRRAPADAPGDPAAAGGTGLWSFVRRSPRLVAATMIAALGPVVIVQAVSGWVAPALTQAHRLTPSRAAGLIALATLMAPVGHLAGGWAIDRVGARRRAAGIVQASLLLLCVPATVALALSGSLGAALVGVAALMLFAGAGSVVGLERVQRLAPPAMTGATNGLFLLLVDVIGVGGGPATVGLIATGGHGVGAALVATVAIAATIAAAGVLSAFMTVRSAEARDQR